MKTTVLNPEFLAQHLEVAADQYDRDATKCREHKDLKQKEGMERLARQFDDQAKQARAWAHAARNVTRLGFEGDDIEMTHD